MTDTKIRLTPKLNVKTKINPKLQQSLKILSMNRHDLASLIQDALENNPLLEWESSRTFCADIYEQSLNYVKKDKTLSEVLNEQLHYSFDHIDFNLAEYLIDLLDDNGYLRYLPEELADTSGHSLSEISSVLQCLKKLEPAGIFAYDLKECLLLQLDRISDSALAKALVSDNLEDIAKKHYEYLIKKYNCSDTDLKHAILLIQSCHPKPANNFSNDAAIIFPEIRVELDENNEFVFMLIDSFQELRIREIQAFSQDEKTYIREKKQQASYLIQAIRQRNKTLLRITSCICEYQKNFFVHHDPLLPLTQQKIAQACGLSISSVSRCLSQKGIEFNGIFYSYAFFFPSQVCENVSSDEIKAKIRDLISKENKLAPLSDLEIATYFENKGICLTRRVIGKYRKQLGIPNSHYRKIHL